MIGKARNGMVQVGKVRGWRGGWLASDSTKEENVVIYVGEIVVVVFSIVNEETSRIKNQIFPIDRSIGRTIIKQDLFV
jgi:hypothetical protein